MSPGMSLGIDIGKGGWEVSLLPLDELNDPGTSLDGEKSGWRCSGVTGLV